MRRIKLVIAVASMALLLVAFAAPAMAKGNAHHNDNNDNVFFVNEFGFDNSCPFANDFEGPVNVLDCFD